MNSAVEGTVWCGKGFYSSGKSTPDDFTRCHFGVSSLRDGKMAQFSKVCSILAISGLFKAP